MGEVKSETLHQEPCPHVWGEWDDVIVTCHDDHWFVSRACEHCHATEFMPTFLGHHVPAPLHHLMAIQPHKGPCPDGCVRVKLCEWEAVVLAAEQIDDAVEVVSHSPLEVQKVVDKWASTDLMKGLIQQTQIEVKPLEMPKSVGGIIPLMLSPKTMHLDLKIPMWNVDLGEAVEKAKGWIDNPPPNKPVLTGLNVEQQDGEQPPVFAMNFTVYDPEHLGDLEWPGFGMATWDWVVGMMTCTTCVGQGKIYQEHPLKPGVPFGWKPCPDCSVTAAMDLAALDSKLKSKVHPCIECDSPTLDMVPYDGGEAYMCEACQNVLMEKKLKCSINGCQDEVYASLYGKTYCHHHAQLKQTVNPKKYGSDLAPDSLNCDSCKIELYDATTVVKTIGHNPKVKIKLCPMCAGKLEYESFANDLPEDAVVQAVHDIVNQPAVHKCIASDCDNAAMYMIHGPLVKGPMCGFHTHIHMVKFGNVSYTPIEGSTPPTAVITATQKSPPTEDDTQPPVSPEEQSITETLHWLGKD
jgi:hypothetical protein